MISQEDIKIHVALEKAKDHFNQAELHLNKALKETKKVKKNRSHLQETLSGEKKNQNSMDSSTQQVQLNETSTIPPSNLKINVEEILQHTDTAFNFRTNGLHTHIIHTLSTYDYKKPMVMINDCFTLIREAKTISGLHKEDKTQINQLLLALQIESLRLKAISLTSSNPEAGFAATTLFHDLNKGFSRYLRRDNLPAYKLSNYLQEKNLNDFTKTCNDSIIKARPVLEQHRGLKDIAVAIGITVGTLGIGGIALVIRGLIKLSQGQSFFSPLTNTDSVNQMEKVQDTLKELGFK